jgi:hypothetical protein
MPRLLLVALVAVIALGGAGCRRVPAPGGASGSKPDAVRKQAEALALNGFTGGANALKTTFVSVQTNPNATPAAATQASAPKGAPKAAPRAGPPPIIKERVVSTLPSTSESEADDETVKIACEIIEQRLAELDPPVKYRPSENEVRNEFLRRDSRIVRPPDPAEQELFGKHLGRKDLKLKYVEYDVEITADQVRELRTRDRVAGTLRVFGAIAAFALVGFLFLRADEWTKGYLTHWLAVAAVLLAGGTAAALYFV